MIGLATVLVAMVAASAGAGEIDVALRAGTTLPFYEQTFPVGLSLPRVPGVSLSQEGALALEARGGVLLGAGLRWWPRRALGLEARFDSGAVEPSVAEPVFLVGVNLPPFGSLPAVSISPNTTLDIGDLRPVSANLALRHDGLVRVVVSGGLSYLPAMTFSVREQLSIDLAVLDIDLPALVAGGEIPGRVGANAGVAVEVPLGHTLAFQVEGRIFVFQNEVLDWRASQLAGTGPVEELLVDALRDSLEPVEFTPGFFHVSGGIVLTF